MKDDHDDDTTNVQNPYFRDNDEDNSEKQQHLNGISLISSEDAPIYVILKA